MSPLKLAFLSLSRRRMTTLIAVFSIAISVACSGILLRLYLVSESRFESLASGGDAIVGAKSGGIEILLAAYNGEGDYPGFIPYTLFETLRESQSIKFEEGPQIHPTFVQLAIPLLYFGKSGEFPAMGTDESFFTRPISQDAPRFSDGKIFSAENDIVIGSTVATQLDLKVGESISVGPWLPSRSLATSTKSFKISGVLEQTGSTWDRTLFSSIPTAQQALLNTDLMGSSIWGTKVLNYFIAYLHPGGYNDLASLINQRSVAQAVNIEKTKAQLKELAGTGTSLGLFTTALILTLGGLSSATLLMTRFEAMSTQLAVLRAIGFKKKAIGHWLLWEGFLLGFAACTLGALMDMLAFPVVRSILGSTLPAANLVSSSLLNSFPVWIIAMMAILLSVFVPLYRIYHQDVHFSLRN